MAQELEHTGMVAALSGGAGASIAAITSAWSRNRKVDKVDAVAAISHAYERVIQRLEAQVDSLEKQVGDLRNEMRRRDELFERLLEKASTPPVAVVTTSAPERAVRKTDLEGEA